MARDSPQAVGSCRWQACCGAETPGLGGEALGSIPGFAPTLQMTLNMTLSMRRPSGLSVSHGGLDQTN